ncbi:NigD-like protein [uncultured Proteiniphilum sp.]|uniref:NigD-like protein n=1 Tax=uncultured Proteiniphilum sp. TaxID=497637 RepID=UPI002639BB64|nr:NigD-like protein [uncultured Proteiniphilum sp.]
MKRTVLTFSLLLIGILLITTSCDDNSRSPDFRINIATVIPEGENAYSLLLDNGKRLWPAASDIRYTPAYNQRVFLNYTILRDSQGEYDYDIKVNDIWNILTKQTIELNAENADSIGNDPVKANAVWVGGDYLNVSFMFNYGGIRPHAINLVENTLSSEVSPDAIELEFRHNSYQSPQTRLYEGFVCFDLKPFRIDDADLVNLSIKVKEWDREIIYNVVYRYNQPAAEAITQMPIPVISSNEYY